MSRSLTAILLLLCGTWTAAGEEREFDAQVAPVLAQHCLDCHGGAEPKGGLDLSRQESVLRGGESGPAIEPGKPEESLLWQRVRDGEMPPKKPLDDPDREVLRKWIEGGGEWGTDPIDPFRFTTSHRAGYDWWSLQPLTSPTRPAAGSGWARNDVDRFIAARLEQAGQSPSTEADRRALIRRLSFDLLGLPPSPEEVAEFVADDRPDAYERLVDRLLVSPHYGIRWGRHWLDIVRFGESQGFERDKLRENAWPYRDWVIDAFNTDRPYDEFARLQVAGDVTQGAGRDGIVATGFLVAGPWDEVGQNQQSEAMKKFVRQDEMEDYVGVVGQTFLGLTVHCARCHDHKFDPISQAEYYRLAAALDGVHHGSRDVMSDDGAMRSRAIADEIRRLAERLAAMETSARSRAGGKTETDPKRAAVPSPIARWTFDEDLRESFGQFDAEARGSAHVADGKLVLDGTTGYAQTSPLDVGLREKTLEAWVQLDALDQRGGGVIGVESLDGTVFDTIVFGERFPRQWMAGSEHLSRTEPFSGIEEKQANKRPMHVAIVYQGNGTIIGYRDGEPYGVAYQTGGPATFEAGQCRLVFGLRHTPAREGKLLAGRIDAAQLYDRALTPEEVAASRKAGPVGRSQGELLAAMSPEEVAEWRALRSQLVEWNAERERHRPMSVYAVQSSAPGIGRVLTRGNPHTPAGEVAAGGIGSVRGVVSDFGLPAAADDASRRLALAEWLTSPENPLFSRVIVNRAWQYHFGVGLVETSSDFGFNGGQPSHPELLDWLAGEFLRRGQSLKELHRLIVTSATYRQSSRYRPEPAQRDAQNRLLWRMSPRRLEAEELRDTILSLSGQLNSQMGGPGYRDFETYVRNTQFYQMLDPAGPEFERRTVYRTWIRSARSSLLDVFDCPDPSTKSPQRAVTVTPLQALSLLNNSFVLRMSEQLAEHLREQVGTDPAVQIRRAYELAYGRNPSADELEEGIAFSKEFGLPELCRVIFNSSEFLSID